MRAGVHQARVLQGDAVPLGNTESVNLLGEGEDAQASRKRPPAVCTGWIGTYLAQSLAAGRSLPARRTGYAQAVGAMPWGCILQLNC